MSVATAGVSLAEQGPLAAAVIENPHPCPSRFVTGGSPGQAKVTTAQRAAVRQPRQHTPDVPDRGRQPGSHASREEGDDNRGDQSRAWSLRYLVVAVNDRFWVGQLPEPIFTLSVTVPVAFLAVLKWPLTEL